MFIDNTFTTPNTSGWNPKTGQHCCPECGQPQGVPNYLPCTCQHLMIAIPPGEHIHISCPRHGRVRVDGPMVTW